MPLPSIFATVIFVVAIYMLIRTGLPLSLKGGAFPPLRLIANLGAGGPLGSFDSRDHPHRGRHTAHVYADRIGRYLGCRPGVLGLKL